jgi:transcription-repair coupling factor (superfamily II helicase)
LRLGAPLDVDFLIDVLIEYGFERVDFVFEAGQFALRGGLIDVFSYAHELPCRIELDGDTIAGMRSFEPDSQRSVRRMELLSLMPNPAQSLPDEQRQKTGGPYSLSQRHQEHSLIRFSNKRATSALTRFGAAEALRLPRSGIQTRQPARSSANR